MAQSARTHRKPSFGWAIAFAVIWIVLLFEARRIPGTETLGEKAPLWLAIADAGLVLASGLVLAFDWKFSLKVVASALAVFFVSSISLGIVFQNHLSVFVALLLFYISVRLLLWMITPAGNKSSGKNGRLGSHLLFL